MITVVLPISRTDFLRPVFNCLRELEKPEDTELIIVTDGDENLQKAVDKRLDSLSDFKLIKILNFGEKPAETINERRYRISAIHNYSKQFVNPASEFVMLLEDDGVYSSDSLTRLLNTAKDRPNLGSISGVQVGRHKATVVGVWYTDDVAKPTEIETLPVSIGVQSVDACGMYFLLARADAYRQINHRPFGDEVQQNLLGPDVNFGIELRRLGYDNYVDWQVGVDHLTDKGVLNTKTCTVDTIKFRKGQRSWEFRKKANVKSVGAIKT